MNTSKNEETSIKGCIKGIIKRMIRILPRKRRRAKKIRDSLLLCVKEISGEIVSPIYSNPPTSFCTYPSWILEYRDIAREIKNVVKEAGLSMKITEIELEITIKRE